MKKLYLILLIISIIGIFFLKLEIPKRVNEEPIRIFIEKGLPKKSITIWKKKVEWISETNNPDLIIRWTNYLPKHQQALFVWYGKGLLKNCQRYMERPAYIYVLNNNLNREVPLAHDFGNFLTLKDDFNKITINSIMHPSFKTINKPLEWFIEFSNKE